MYPAIFARVITKMVKIDIMLFSLKNQCREKSNYLIFPIILNYYLVFILLSNNCPSKYRKNKVQKAIEQNF